MRIGAMAARPGRENGPHVRAQCIHRPLEILQTRRERRRTRKSHVDVVDRTAERGQLLGEWLVRHMEIPIEEEGLGPVASRASPM